MKKKLSYLLIFMMLLSCVSNVAIAKTSSKTPKVIGQMYTTNITAYIDDMPINCYIINGQTVVSVNDLKKYGFFNPKQSELVKNAFTKSDILIAVDKPAKAPEVQVSKEKPGIIKASVYPTDLTILYNYIQIDAYKANGQTMIPLGELGKMPQKYKEENMEPNSELNYSGYGCKVIWNANKKTVHVYILRPGSMLSTTYGTYKINYAFCAYTYNSSYNKDLPLTTINPLMSFTYKSPLKNYQFPYVSLKQTFSCFSVTSSWENGNLIINNPIVKKNASYNFRDDSDVGYSSILPVVSLPIKVNINGSMTNIMVKAIVYHGEFYICLIDLAPYLFSNYVVLPS